MHRAQMQFFSFFFFIISHRVVLKKRQTREREMRNARVDFICAEKCDVGIK